jgi:hypothetical protein
VLDTYYSRFVRCDECAAICLNARRAIQLLSDTNARGTTAAVGIAADRKDTARLLSLNY